MSTRARIHAGALNALLWLALLAGGQVTGIAQVVGPASPAAPDQALPAPAPIAPCSRPPIQCGAPYFNATFAMINLEPDASSVCRFDPRLIEDLRLEFGDRVDWTFCNACDTDMTVQLDTAGSGPFSLSTFERFFPFPTADNLVSVDVPCHGWGSVAGIGARQEGDWKYSLRARPAGTVEFPDEIDPRLEIDDRGGLRAAMPMVALGVALLAGLTLGFLLSRLFVRQRIR